MTRVPYQELFDVLLRVLLKLGFEPGRARMCAQLFTDTSRDGVYSHGLNRFPRFVAMIRNGSVDIHGRPERVTGHGALERWNGHCGPGNLNAHQSMARAIELSKQHGLGCVALAHTNHWMRGGSYGWQAADAGIIAICWTNTMPNLPPWGATDPRLGNNPLVIAAPRPQGHVVLDLAMSQFSFGALDSYRKRGESLPVDGGYDGQGRLTKDPGAIEESNRPLPIGYWKGSGLALLLDLVAALLSGGRATHQIPPDSEREADVSQMFVAFDLPAVDREGFATKIADEIIGHLHESKGPKGGRVRYPGEQVMKTRQENMENGIPVDPVIWQQVKAM